MGSARVFASNRYGTLPPCSNVSAEEREEERGGEWEEKTHFGAGRKKIKIDCCDAEERGKERHFLTSERHPPLFVLPPSSI